MIEELELRVGDLQGDAYELQGKLQSASYSHTGSDKKTLRDAAELVWQAMQKVDSLLDQSTPPWIESKR